MKNKVKNTPHSRKNPYFSFEYKSWKRCFLCRNSKEKRKRKRKNTKQNTERCSRNVVRYKVCEYRKYYWLLYFPFLYFTYITFLSCVFFFLMEAWDFRMTDSLAHWICARCFCIINQEFFVKSVIIEVVLFNPAQANTFRFVGFVCSNSKFYFSSHFSYFCFFSFHLFLRFVVFFKSDLCDNGIQNTIHSLT